ncbi:NAD(P)/FAD-dependent oxidoreductase [Motiliproteus sediminis]|uniref:NAD(P)/FAD-dependent oxidoreductase n=1 Tax=Motiliproteus sediminis TaxID=1468178 RepID=UPI001AEF6B10|nr:FAD-dependent oxidoreductase [Motiliproteus sediminis]
MRYVIIGAGPAGVTAAETLRGEDPNGEIILVGEEPEPPYSRMAIPYLLVEKIGEAGTYLRKQDDFYRSRAIELVQQRVTALDTAAQGLSLADGSTLAYDRLLIATGATPVRPPIDGIDSPQVSTCWTLADARRIVESAQPGSEVVLMGAGFIGCIILEALAMREVKLTVVEMGDRMVPRMMNDKAGNLIKQWCINKGVQVLTSAQVTAIRAPQAAANNGGGLMGGIKKLFGGGENAAEPAGKVTVELKSGEKIAADLVISATGVRSNLAFLQGSGIDTEQGIKVDRQLRTSADNVWAAGDVAQGRDFSTGDYQVQAIQPTSVEHGKIAALNMAGASVEHRGSINMNVLDTLGLISSSFGLWMGVEDGDSVERYWPEAFRYICLQFRGDVLVGASCVGMTQHIGVLRGLIQTETPLGAWKQKLMEDPTRVMEAYLASAQGATLVGSRA